MQHIFDASNPSMKTVRTENFDTKETSKFQILSYKIVAYLKRWLRTCTIRIYQEKIDTCAILFFKFFFQFSQHA